MRTIHMYVEGKHDLVFLSQFLTNAFTLEFKLDLKKWKATTIIQNKLSLNIQTITPKEGQGGIDAKKIQDLIKEIKSTNIPRGIESILLIDADTDQHEHPKGGFVARDQYLQNLQQEVPFKYFIIPTHQEDGNLESILDNIVCDRGRDFYSCLTQYVDGLLALKGDSRPQYVVENPQLMKEKIAWYIYMMEGKDKKVESGLQNTDLWLFTAEKLSPLKNFMAEVITS